jgi:hypothetical protein
VEGAFYEARADGTFASSELTRGPWDPGSQHAGPPAALLAREVERLPGDRPLQVGRITFELLRPVPIAPLRAEARVTRPGRSVELVEAKLSAAEEVVMRATAWRLRLAEVDLSAALTSAGESGGEPPPTSGSVLRPGFSPPGPETGADAEFFPVEDEVGYFTAMERSFVAGAFLEPGPATVWMRMRCALVAGESPSPLQRTLVAADSGNGVSATLELGRYLFINVDLTVHMHRMPAGEWICLDAITIPERTGIGLADTALYDERGPIGRADQTLLIGERDG